jgi:hypothetical protein
MSQGLPIDVPNHLLYFLHVQHRVRISQGLPIDVPNHLFTFYTRITAYKKQGASDRCSIHHLLLSAHASSCTKSKGLPIDTPYIYFQHAYRHVLKARGS